MSQAFQVFISHFTGEKRLAETLQNLLKTAFGDELHVFRSSDAESIATGEGQYAAILNALQSAVLIVVLLASESSSRPWVAFESGYALGKKARLFPLLVRGTILRRHLVEHVPISELCDKHGLQPTVFYRWQKEFFENGRLRVIRRAFSPLRRPVFSNLALPSSGTNLHRCQTSI